MELALVMLAATVTVAPLAIRRIGDNLEPFLFVAGVAAVTFASRWSWKLVQETLRAPLSITAAVLGAGALFYLLQRPLERGLGWLKGRVDARVLVVGTIAVVGFLSSFLTAVIASLVMVEAVKRLALEKRTESAVVVLACFSIGLGAALTPFGEPLAAVAISRLSDAPYHAGTWFLLETLGMYVTPGILLVSVASLFFVREAMPPSAAGAGDRRETLVGALVRAGKVYLFVVGLLLLGAGFTPLISRLVSSVPWPVLFWANLSSAVLDNATLTATEIVPSMTSHQLVAALMGLLIAGGMLVPGNLPNVIAAGRLGIDSRTWARIGVPVGLGMMAATCAALALGG